MLPLQATNARQAKPAVRAVLRVDVVVVKEALASMGTPPPVVGAAF
jgi:hypothetical protein